METIEKQISLHQNTIAQCIFTSLILDMYIVEEWCPGRQVLKQWWGQEGHKLVINKRGGNERGGGEVRDGRDIRRYGGGQQQRLSQRVTVTPNATWNRPQ